MKFIAVTVVRGGARDGFQFKYPAAYNAEEIERSKRGPLVYAGHMTQGDADQEEMLVCLVDGVADKLLADPSRRCRQLTAVQANAWLAACPALQSILDEVVSDPNRVALVVAKVAAGIALSQDDRDCLDPDNPKAGVRRSPPKTVAGIFRI